MLPGQPGPSGSRGSSAGLIVPAPSDSGRQGLCTAWVGSAAAPEVAQVRSGAGRAGPRRAPSAARAAEAAAMAGPLPRHALPGPPPASPGPGGGPGPSSAPWALRGPMADGRTSLGRAPPAPGMPGGRAGAPPDPACCPPLAPCLGDFAPGRRRLPSVFSANFLVPLLLAQGGAQPSLPGAPDSGEGDRNATSRPDRGCLCLEPPAPLGRA